MIESAKAYQSSSAIRAMAWSPSGQFIAIADDDQIEILDTTNNNQSVQVISTNSPTTSIAWRPFSNNAEIATGHKDSHVRHWNITNAQELANLQYQTHSVTAIAWSPDGVNLAATGQGNFPVKVWNVENQQLVGEVDWGLYWYFTSIHWMAENIIVVTISDGEVLLIDTNNFEIVQQFVASFGPGIDEFALLTSSLSPNGNLIAAGGNDDDSNGILQVSIINMQTGQLVTSLVESNGVINSLAWSPDGSRLAIGDSDMVKVRDTSTWQLLTTITPNEGQIGELAWHPDSSFLAYSTSGNGGQGGSVTIIEVLQAGMQALGVPEY